MQLDNLLCYRKSKSRAACFTAAGAVQPAELVENPSELFGRNFIAAICKSYHDIAARKMRGQLNLAVVPAVIHSVSQKIVERAGKLVGVRVQPKSAFDIAGNFHAFFFEQRVKFLDQSD